MKKYIFYCAFSFGIAANHGVNANNGIDTVGPVKTADSVFRKVEIEASFQGGDALWRAYLQKNLNPDVPMDNFAPPGTYTTIVQFVVDKAGLISDVKPLTNYGFGMEEEVASVIMKGPNWKPAIQDGKPVKAYRKQPVTFHVMYEFELSTYSIKAGEENAIKLKSDGTDPEALDMTVSAGTIQRQGGGRYIVTVDKPGRVYVTVWITIKKKKQEMGKVAVEVK